MAKLLSSISIDEIPPAPKDYCYDLHSPDVFWPRMYFVLKSLATNPSSMLFEHKKFLADDLSVHFQSSAVGVTFALLKINYLIRTTVGCIAKNRNVDCVYLTKWGKVLASEFGINVVESDLDRVHTYRPSLYSLCCGRIAHFAYLCRKCDIPVEVAPQIETKQPPDLLVGNEKRWVYVSKDRILAHEYVKSHFEGIPDDQPVGFVLMVPTMRKKLMAICAKYGFSATFTDVETLIDNEQMLPKDNQLWISSL